MKVRVCGSKLLACSDQGKLSACPTVRRGVMPLVTSEQVGTAAVITLERADKRNALSRALIAELRSVIEGTRDNNQIRTVILAARGPVFCAGMDLSELQESLDRPQEQS